MEKTITEGLGRDRVVGSIKRKTVHNKVKRTS